MPKRSISAAANGAVSPYSARLTETAKPIVPRDQPNSVCSGSISRPGREREGGRADDRHEGDGGDGPGAVDSQVRAAGCRGPALAGGHRDVRCLRHPISLRWLSLRGEWPKSHLCKESGHGAGEAPH